MIETSPESNGDEHTVVGSFVQKSQTGWNLQYTFDESLCARVVTNEVQFFQSDNLSKVWNKLRVEGVSDFALSPGKNNSIAVFIPERKVGFLFFFVLIVHLSQRFTADLLGSLRPGSTSSGQGVQRASVRSAHLPEELFQG